MDILEDLPPDSREGALRLLSSAEVCRIGYWDGYRPFVLPMNFVYLEGLVFLHTGPSKGKLEGIKRFPTVCVQFDEIGGIVRGNNPCGISYSFISLLVHGQAFTEGSSHVKQKVLSGFSHKYSGEPFVFTETQLDSVTVLKILPDRASVKLKNMDKLT